MKLAVLVSVLVILPFQADAAVATCVGKNVDVWVANGNDLTGDGLQEPDPYVKVTIGAVTKQTKVVYDNSNPSWWEKLQFQRVTTDIMRIDIWERDGGLRGDDDHLGTCMQQLVKDGSQYRSVLCKARESGYVKLFYKCY